MSQSTIEELTLVSVHASHSHGEDEVFELIMVKISQKYKNK